MKTKIITIICCVALFLFVVINWSMVEIEKDMCLEELEKLNISRCDRIDVIHTILPFKWSTKCYCENSDRIYFEMGENKK